MTYFPSLHLNYSGPRDYRPDWTRSLWPKEMVAFEGSGAAYADIIEKLRYTGRFDFYDGDMPVDNSDDSYNAFARRNPILLASYQDMLDKEERRRQASDTSNRRWAAKVAEEQEKWEAERRARQAEKERVADREWRAAEVREEKWKVKQWWSANWPEFPADEMVEIDCVRSCEYRDGDRVIQFIAGNHYWAPAVLVRTVRLTPIEEDA